MQAPSSIETSYGGGSAGTLMHPLVAVAMVAAIVGLMKLPRRYAVVPLLLALFLLPVGQQLHIAGVHFYVPRILVMFGVARLISAKGRSKGPIFVGGWNGLDTLFTCCTVVHAVAIVLLNLGNISALINEVATIWDTLGGYLIFRYLIRDVDDIKLIAKTFACIAAVIGFTMVIERTKMLNVFGYFGSLDITPQMRGDKIRAQGPFEHPLLAGAFGATVVPLFVWLWKSKESRKYAITGILGSTAMVLATASSTPLLSYVAGIVAIMFWPIRKNMRVVRWAVVLALVGLDLVMKAPVWFLIARIDIVSGSSGFHRAELIDTFVRHFNEWWLIGTKNAANWGFEMQDTCNEWVEMGETGGLATLLCFVLLVVRSFSRIGKARKRAFQDHDRAWLIWLVGAALFAHAVAFYGISYFDQTKFSWFALLCMISVVTAPKQSAILSPKPQASWNSVKEEKRLQVTTAIGA